MVFFSNKLKKVPVIYTTIIRKVSLGPVRGPVTQPGLSTQISLVPGSTLNILVSNYDPVFQTAVVQGNNATHVMPFLERARLPQHILRGTNSHRRKQKKLGQHCRGLYGKAASVEISPPGLICWGQPVPGSLAAFILISSLLTVRLSKALWQNFREQWQIYWTFLSPNTKCNRCTLKNKQGVCPSLTSLIRATQLSYATSDGRTQDSKPGLRTLWKAASKYTCCCCRLAFPSTPPR